MKIMPVSDVHLEFGVDGEAFVESLSDADVCVIAGDLHLARFLDQIREALRPFSEKFDQVVYVPGNHEYYRSEVHEVNRVIGVACQEFSNVHLLRPSHPLVYKGQLFIGGTMWFPDGPFNLMRSGMLNDFHLIRNFTPWVYEQNTEFRKMLKSDLSPDAVVVTHHLPAEGSIASRFRGSAGNIFFLSDQEMDISWRQPKLWIHGHTHEACDYMLGETRVICNPVGYPHERKPFNPNMIVEVK